jgi:TetR/AcrR family transcriptional repressor of mexJK operon
MKQSLHLAGWRRAMTVTMKQSLHLAGWRRAMTVKNPAKREAVLNAASALFVERGFNGTSMGQVADAAGVSKQTIYSHFRDKEHLFAEVVAMKLREYGIDCAVTPLDADAEAPDPSAALLAVGMALGGMAAEPDVVMINRLIIAEARNQPEFAAMFYRTAPLRSIKVIADLLRSLRGRGLSADMDCDEAAWDLRNLWIGRYQSASQSVTASAGIGWAMP